MTQAEVGRAMGLSQGYIAKIEARAIRRMCKRLALSRPTVLALLALLGMQTDRR